MANQQLLDYVKQQIQLGVGKEAIKSALLASGWPSAEVDEALGTSSPAGAASAAASQPVAAAKPAAAAVSSPAAGISAATKPVGVSFDSTSAASKSFAQAQPAKSEPAKVAFSGPKSFEDIGHPAHPHHWLLPAILGVVVVALLGALWYLYSQNSSLSAQLKSTSDTSGSAAQQLNTQITTLNNDKTDLTNQIGTLATANKNLTGLLALYSVSTSTTEQTITVSGVLGGNDKAGYTLTTSEQVVVNIKNSRDASPALKSLVGSNATLDGTFLAGSKSVTVTKVNGTDLSAANAAAAAAAPAPQGATSTGSSTRQP